MDGDGRATSQTGLRPAPQRVTRPTMTLFESDASRSNPKKTFPIFGVPRGGTTSVAGCTRKLGLFLGDSLPVNLEDPAFGPAVKGHAKAVRQRNVSHPVWGWKYPNAVNYLSGLAGRLRNARFVVVTRDLSANALSIAERQEVSDPQRALEIVMLQTQANMSLITRLRRPTLLLSYEKLLSKPEETIRELAAFLVLKPTDAQIADTVSFVKPGAYRRSVDSLPSDPTPPAAAP